jgi:hypothetical protein
VPTSFLLFITSSTGLYLKNQAELDYQNAVLLPFVKLFLFAWILGVVLYLLRSKSLFRYILWGYYLGGPFVLTYRFLLGLGERQSALYYYFLGWLVDSYSGLALWTAAFAFAVVVAGRKVQLRSVIKPLAVFATLLILGEAAVFFLSSSKPESHARPPASPEPPARGIERPNVYHLVFDGLQTEIFEASLPPDRQQLLGGFVCFPANKAIYHGTAMSLASMFSSRLYRYDRPMDEFIDQGFGRGSFLSTLERAGFETTAVVPSAETVHTTLFGEVVRHGDHARQSVAMNTEAFMDLWIFNTIPPVIRRGFMRSEWLSEQTKTRLRKIAGGRALAESAPVTSYLSFLEVIESEEIRADTGRYTFVHLLIPHDPYVLRSDCSYDDESPAADPLPQSRCSVRLLQMLIDRLHELGRFESSLIVVHGDHGATYRLRNDSLVRTRARSLRTPLLVKPVGAKRTVDFRMSEAETTLLDVAPTILEELGWPPEPAFEGISLYVSAARSTEKESSW